MLTKTKKALMISCAVLISLVQFNLLQMSVFALPLPQHRDDEVVNLSDPEWRGENPITRGVESILGRKFAQKITYGDLKTIKKLLLFGSGLTDLPPAIGYLINLEYLDLSSNRFTSVPDAILCCNNLVYLDMDDNQIVDVPDWLGGFPKLKNARFDKNPLVNIKRVIGSLNMVVAHELSNYEYRLDTARPLNLKTHLPLGTDFFIYDVLSSISGTVVDIDSAEWEGVTPLLLRAIETQIPGEKSFTRDPRVTFGDLANVKVLELTNDSILRVPGGMKYFLNLKKLLLPFNNIKYLDRGLLCLKNLKAVDLSGNALDGNLNRWLINIPNSVRYLDLSNNKIDISFPFSKSLVGGFKVLNLSGNPLRPEYKQLLLEMKPQFPNLNLILD